jgi:signal transduction histidine kinase
MARLLMRRNLLSAKQVMPYKTLLNVVGRLASRNGETRSRFEETADALMIDRTRLVLSISALLTALIDPAVVDDVTGFTLLVLHAYALHSLVLYLLPKLAQPFLQSTLIHWLDALWYTLIVFFTGGSNSIFFLFFLFAILASSFRWGFQEGARVTVASSVLFSIVSLASQTDTEIPRLLLRTTFILALGYMIAYWGESEIAQKRRLALLRDVSRLSNPRFGVDHTIASILEKTRLFFSGSNCILVTQDDASAIWALRTATAGKPVQAIKAQPLGPETAAPLMAFPQEQIVVYTRPLWSALPRAGGCLVHDPARGGWVRHIGEAGEKLAELLEARSFITAPLRLRKGKGRIYVVSSGHDFSKEDASFLSDICAQTLPTIENIELLDRLASGAALQERRKIARDLHDTTIQPYIGLTHGLSAVRNKAASDNPLNDDLDKLTVMAKTMINDLRHYARTLKSGPGLSEPVFLAALRRQAAQAKEFYGIDVMVGMEGEFDMSDRLGAEVFQIANEGMSNIRKHTSARHGTIWLKCVEGRIRIRIENECLGEPATDFLPGSIVERANALGGNVRIERMVGNKTVVHVDIPI